ncbi:MAG: hypothetical protein ABIQ06_14920 [Caldimonas sp.]
MKLSRLLLSLAAVAACATAQAAPYDSADQARRDRNREEIMAKNGLDSTTYRADTSRREGETKTVKSQTRRAVAATKSFGHRTAEKMREIGARTNAKFPPKGSAAKNP